MRLLLCWVNQLGPVPLQRAPDQIVQLVYHRRGKDYPPKIRLLELI